MTSDTIAIGQRVLVHGRYAGIVQFGPAEVASMAGTWVGVALDRRVGNNNGSIDGKAYFTCAENHGIFVRESALKAFSAHDGAACTLQNMWRRYRAIKTFKATLNAITWNMLDNHQEQLNLKRAERTKSAEKALALLAKSQQNQEQDNVPTAIEVDYSGIAIRWPLTLENIREMMDYFKEGHILHHKYVLEVLEEARTIFAPLPTLQEIPLQKDHLITIVGDLHGQLQDLYTIFSINGLPSEKNQYLFNGDFVDRGDYGTEVVMTILCFKLLYPNAVFLNRGNHESRNQNSWMGFEDEIFAKYDGSPSGDPARAKRIFNAFQACFDSLPLCALVHSKIFVTHGGLFSRDGVTLAHIKAIKRKREPPLHQPGFEDHIFEDLLWSDPRNIMGRQPSDRGAGVEFGQAVTNNFCAVNRVVLIVRSHECVREGYEVLHGGRLITLFSASRYCGTQMNKGAFLTVGPDLQPEVRQFYADVMHKIDFGNSQTSNTDVDIPDATSDALHQNLVQDNMRMIAERICDHKPSLYWYFTQHDQERSGMVSRLVWAEALRSVLKLDIPFLNFQTQLAEVDDNGKINYSRFLARYRIENTAVDNTGWQEVVISNICKKLYKAIGAGNLQEAFRTFDADENGFIEYEEFMTTLKSMDTGLSDQQVYELMRTADENDDGRIDFREFAERFEVIFTKVRGHQEDVPMADVSVAETTSPTSNARRIHRRYSDKEKESMNPIPASNIDDDTMVALQSIGRAIVSREDTLSDLFVKFDTNQDGVLQRDEFYSALHLLGFDFNEEQKKKIMAAIDVDQGDTIDYKEFLDAFSVQDKAEPMNIEKGNMTWQQSVLQQVANVFYQHRIHIRSAFRMFDRDNSGTITKEEFRVGITSFNSMLDSPLTTDQIEGLLDHLDKNGDGVLSYREFFDGFEIVDVVHQ